MEVCNLFLEESLKNCREQLYSFSPLAYRPFILYNESVWKEVMYMKVYIKEYRIGFLAEQDSAHAE